MSGLTNRNNVVPKFGKPVFIETMTAGLSEARNALAWDNVYVFAVGPASTTVSVRLWGKFSARALAAVPTTVAPTTSAPTTGPGTTLAPTTAPAVDSDFEDVDVWVSLGTLSPNIAAAEANAPDSPIADELRSEIQGQPLYLAALEVKVELLSASAPVTIWVGGAADA